jgi:hypothetical protein
LQSSGWLATLQTAWGVERSRDDCPWVFIGKGKPSPDRILKKTGRISHFCTTESESRLSRVTPLIRVTLYIYVLVIKPHCDDICATLGRLDSHPQSQLSILCLAKDSMSLYQCLKTMLWEVFIQVISLCKQVT